MPKDKNPSFLKIDTSKIKLLERLSNAVAVSGDEREVRAIIREEIEAHADEIKIDPLGNLLAVRKSKAKNPLRVMLDAHMDEIGFMLVEEEEGGWFKFETVGGIDPRQLVGKTVLAGKEHLPGVIGARPIHLTTAEERQNIIPVDNLRIDLGPENAKKVKPGDRAAFATRFVQVGASLMGKALDNRLGVATLIELLKNPPENVELLAAFTVQEEVGLRGARVAAYALNPQLAIAIDSTPAYDLPDYDGEENTRYNTRLGAGPAIYIADVGTLSDPRLIRHLAKTGDALGIPYQYRQPGGGGTDAGAIHRQHQGIPVVSVSVPGRYAHTAVMVARLEDWQNTLNLLYHGLARLTAAVLAEPR
jgi:tetrahedral aminopeptidase